MSRWSVEEDNNIIEVIKLLDDEPNYVELVEYHNKNFNTKRTDIAYKSRVIKLAKENNIELKSKVYWTEKDKEFIISEVNKNQFNIYWEDIGKQLNRSEESVKRMYLSIISAEDHVKSCINSIDHKTILELIETNKNICTHCNCTKFSNMFIWKEKEYCDECYNILFRNELEERWKLVHRYSIDKNKISCNICNKSAIIDNSIAQHFHYDHIDMFDKSSSVCEMVRTGVIITDIYDEIDKCQLLCISCHKIVTKIEHLCGFIRFKRQLVKEYNDSTDVLKKESLISEYSNIYNKFMSKIYEILKDKLN